MWARFEIQVPIPGRKSFTFVCLPPSLPGPIHSPSFSASLPWKRDLYRLYQQLPYLWLLMGFGKRKLSQETDRRTMVSSPRLLAFRGLPRAGTVTSGWPRPSVVTALVGHSLHRVLHNCSLPLPCWAQSWSSSWSTGIGAPWLPIILSKLLLLTPVLILSQTDRYTTYFILRLQEETGSLHPQAQFEGKKCRFSFLPFS